ncbi:right-handed parallel beta-helix repeat-containing protein [Streptomyces sp. NPDC019396]|uniref:right-handed parallel beta-helix repeat-containing protein n=1 Tax=Streptomyces sp. NPDC019396 TaxID=3154687 RepID=UPI0033D64145
MTKRQITYLGCAALLAASGMGAAVPAHAAGTHDVQPGESIQAAVNAAKPGDVITIGAGTFHESVTITTSDLTLRGAGKRTVIAPPATAGKDACAQKGNGICVIGTDARPVEGVQIGSLTVRAFKKNGVWASRTDDLTVRKVTVEKNGNWGIAQERSVGGEFRGNIARDNAESGIFLSNTTDTEAGALDTKGAVVSGNYLAGNRIGVTIRRLRNLVVEGNAITGNCAGVFVVGDEGVPRTGDLAVRGNSIFQNNKQCPKTARLPEIQGAGIVLTGAEHTTVSGNVVWGHTGKSPFAGGIVLFKSIVGSPNSRNDISNNVLVGNTVPDLANRDTGEGNTFGGNFCKASEPAGMC